MTGRNLGQIRGGSSSGDRRPRLGGDQPWGQPRNQRPPERNQWANQPNGGVQIGGMGYDFGRQPYHGTPWGQSTQRDRGFNIDGVNSDFMRYGGQQAHDEQRAVLEAYEKAMGFMQKNRQAQGSGDPSFFSSIFDSLFGGGVKGSWDRDWAQTKKNFGRVADGFRGLHPELHPGTRR